MAALATGALIGFLFYCIFFWGKSPPVRVPPDPHPSGKQWLAIVSALVLLLAATFVEFLGHSILAYRQWRNFYDFDPQTQVVQFLIGLAFGVLLGFAYEKLFIPLVRDIDNAEVNTTHQMAVAGFWAGILGVTLIVGIFLPNADRITGVKTAGVEITLVAAQPVAQRSRQQLKVSGASFETSTAPWYLISAGAKIQEQIDYLKYVKLMAHPAVASQRFAPWGTCAHDKEIKDSIERLEFLRKMSLALRPLGIRAAVAAETAQHEGDVQAFAAKAASVVESFLFPMQEQKFTLKQFEMTLAAALNSMGASRLQEVCEKPHAKESLNPSWSGDEREQSADQPMSSARLADSTHAYVLAALLNLMAKNEPRARAILQSQQIRNPCEPTWRRDYLLAKLLAHSGAASSDFSQLLENMLDASARVLADRAAYQRNSKNFGSAADLPIFTTAEGAELLAWNEMAFDVAADVAAGDVSAEELWPRAQKYAHLLRARVSRLTEDKVRDLQRKGGADSEAMERVRHELDDYKDTYLVVDLVNLTTKPDFHETDRLKLQDIISDFEAIIANKEQDIAQASLTPMDQIADRSIQRKTLEGARSHLTIARNLLHAQH